MTLKEAIVLTCSLLNVILVFVVTTKTVGVEPMFTFALIACFADSLAHFVVEMIFSKS